MRKPILVPMLLAVSFAFSPSNNYSQRPIPPGLREAEKKTNAPLDPPVKFAPKGADPAVLKQEAEELAKLSAAVPSQMDQVAHGQMPKDLAGQLKRIEKLAKQLRSQISP